MTKKYHMNVLLISFHLNGHTLAFHTQTYKRTNTYHMDVRLINFHLEGHIGFHAETTLCDIMKSIIRVSLNSFYRMVTL